MTMPMTSATAAASQTLKPLRRGGSSTADENSGASMTGRLSARGSSVSRNGKSSR
jgi:hypothetical protein